MRLNHALISLAIVTAAYLGVLVWIDSANGIFDQLHTLAGAMPALLVLTVASWLLRYGRWRWLLRLDGFDSQGWRSLAAYLAGFAFTATPGKVGELVRIRYFARQGVPACTVISAFVFERVLDLVAVLMLAALGWGWFGGIYTTLVVFVCTVAAGVLACDLPRRHACGCRLYAAGRSGFDGSRHRDAADRTGCQPCPGVAGGGWHTLGHALVCHFCRRGRGHLDRVVRPRRLPMRRHFHKHARAAMTHTPPTDTVTTTDRTLPHSRRTRRNARHYASYAALLLSLVFVALAILGGVRQYLPIPFWDMWGGYVGFMTGDDLSTWQAWWRLHNEHRILLTRLLFWVDYRLFDASLVFLIVSNYALAACAAVMFVWALRERIGTLHIHTGSVAIAGLIVMAMFSWLQSENFTWAFQSQFFLAQTVPLASLLALYRSHRTHSRSWLLAAAALGVLACGTMANGVAALPLLVVMAALCGLSLRRVCVLAGVTVAMLGYYFGDYQSTASSRSLAMLTPHAADLVQYTLVYLGAPVFKITRGHAGIAALAGLVLALSALGFLWLACRSKVRDVLGAALALFILYVAATALLTAFGRHTYGVAQAASSRYQTPVLMAWAALLILLAPWLMRALSRRPRLTASALLVIALAMLPQQRLALKRDSAGGFDRWLAVLALDMGVRDDTQLAYLYPFATDIIAYSARLRTANLLPFTHRLLDTVKLGVARQVPADAAIVQCQGTLGDIQALDKAPNFLRIDGSLHTTTPRREQALLQVLDNERRVVGFAVTAPRSRSNKFDADTAKYMTRFGGYLQVDLFDAHAEVILLRDDRSDCEFSLRLPESPGTHQSPPETRHSR